MYMKPEITILWLFFSHWAVKWGFPGGSDVKESTCNAGAPSSVLGSGRSPGEGNGNTPVFLPGEFHGQRSLVDYSPWGCKESDMTEWLTRPLFSSEIHTFTWQNVIFSEVLIIWWSTRWTNTQLFGKCGTQKPDPQMEADAGVLPLLLSELLGLRCFLLVLQPELVLSSLVSNQLYLSLIYL